MENMVGLSRTVFFAALLALLLCIGCAPGQDLPVPASVSSLSPYLTATGLIPVVPTSPATDVPIPSATPSTYKVAPGDTMSGIAEHFAIHLDELLAANPGVIPEALSVGQVLKVPASSPRGGSVSGPTPAPVETGLVACHVAGAGYYCLAVVHNGFPQTLENIKLQINLIDASGHALASQEAFLPLDILPAGGSLPAYAFFPSVAAGFKPVAQLVTSTRLNAGDARYLAVEIQNLLISVDWSGRTGQVQGQVFLPQSGKAARSIWLVAVAYDRDQQIVGFRRWDWQGKLQPGNVQPFAFSVYSFGAVIDRVEVIAEARP